MVKSCRIKKTSNGVGNYSCQYIEDNKIKVCSFSSYEEGVAYAFFYWNLTKETHLQNSVILERE